MRPILPTALLVTLLASTFPAHAGEDRTAHAIASLAQQLDTHRVIHVGEFHRSRELHDFLQALLRDPAFVCRIDDIVVEFGNSRLQPVADAWAYGAEVSEQDLQSMWRETAVPLAWNAPAYRRFYETVRAINQEKLCPKPVRLLLGDPPLDWAKIHDGIDYEPFLDRDGSLAQIVADDVLAKGHRALVVSGRFHALKALPADQQAELAPGELVTAQILERDHPGAVFTVVNVPTPAAAEKLGLGDAPTFFAVQGTPLADADYSLTQPGWTGVTPPASPLPLGRAVDGLLNLGSNHSEFPPPEIYLDPAYQAELRRRMRIIKAQSGQDFESVLDDLIRQADEGGDGVQTNVPKE